MGFIYYLDPGKLYPLFFIFFIVSVLITITTMIIAYKNETGIKKLQLAYLLGAYSIGYLGGSAVFLPVFDIPMPAYSIYGIPICHLLITYALIRYKALDLNLVLRWGLAFGVLATLLGGFIVILVAISEKVGGHFGVQSGIIALLIGCYVVFILGPLKKKITHFIDVFVFKSPDFIQILDGIEKELAEGETINDMAEGLKLQFKKIWGLNHCGIAAWDSAQTCFRLFPQELFKDQIITKLNQKIGINDFLIRTLESERRIFKYGIITEEEITALSSRLFAGQKLTFEKIRRSMRWVGAAACIPLVSNENLIGFIILGPKANHKLYNEEDIKFLSHVSEKVSISLAQLISSPSSQFSEEFPTPNTNPI